MQKGHESGQKGQLSLFNQEKTDFRRREMKPDCNGMNGEHEEMEAVKTVCEKEDFGRRERVGR